ncbi:AbrB/MazE/SpoVT family DNA-binding domain-containing protein [Candidatus Woesearchaeota archaeon]|nr:AbrB/MazE/SpoVT family DNA-binding domain-containing protein [Candidatus Woesearchaeota archaeon]
MKRYPKIVQADARGQIVIPKDIRSELDIDEGTGFYVYSISDEGILLKKISPHDLESDEKIVPELFEKADRIRMSKKNLEASVQSYRRRKKGNLDVI